MPDQAPLPLTCAACGRPLYGHVYTYTLGRRGSAPYRLADNTWRHTDDGTPACEDETPITMTRPSPSP